MLTGLPGSGKTTLAYAVERRLFEMGRAVTVLDGLELRQTISKGLGFTAAERSENLRRGADVARYMNEAGLICLCAFVAPSAAVRQRARQAVGEGRFIEIALTAPIDILKVREQTGAYARAEAGELPDYPGVSAPSDVPVTPDLSLDTSTLTVEECVERIVALLDWPTRRGLIVVGVRSYSCFGFVAPTVTRIGSGGSGLVVGILRAIFVLACPPPAQA